MTKIKNLKVGDIAKSLNDKTLPTMLVIGVRKDHIKAIYDDVLIDIYDTHANWDSNVEVVSSDNDVAQLRRIHKIEHWIAE